ncbi:hypothetical protein D3C85_1624400 [compost metagenome]
MQDFHRHSGVAQARGVVEAVVADRVEAGGEDQRRRQSAQVRAAPRRIPGVRQVEIFDGFGKEGFDQVHPLAGEEITAVDVLLVGRESLQ